MTLASGSKKLPTVGRRRLAKAGVQEEEVGGRGR